MASELYRIYSSLQPVILSGDTADIAVTQDLTGSGKQYLHASGPDVKVTVQGPQTAITESDISGVYPAPGSTDSPDDYLPHIALSRRTLPWERQGPAAGAPWLALLVITQADLSLPLEITGVLNSGALEAVDKNAAVAQNPAVVKNVATTPPAPPPVQGAREAVVANPGIINQVAVNPGIVARPVLMGSSGTITPKSIQISDLKSTDAATHTKLLTIPGLTDTTQINTIAIPASTLKEILPAAGDLKLLCHVKEVVEDGADTFTAIVVSGRLPDAGDLNAAVPPATHAALLVSLEHRDDIYTRFDKGGSINLIVLHSWTFVPSKGGDFREVCQSIALRPNGGVMRFGNLPKAASGSDPSLSGGFASMLDSSGYLVQPLDHVDVGDVVWRSPLRPFPPPARSQGFAVRSEPEEFAGQPANTPLDYSHATAFELGKLLALTDDGLREDLREIHMIFNVPTNFVAMSNIPPALQKPFWGIDQGETEQQAESQMNQALNNSWSFGSNQSMVGISNTLGQGEVSGISAANAQSWQASLVSVMGTPATAPVATPSQVSQIDIATVSESTLAVEFPEVVNAGMARG